MSEPADGIPAGKDPSTTGSHGMPDYGALFGIDFGTKRIGVAISNPEQTMSMPLENYTLMALLMNTFLHLRLLSPQNSKKVELL